jgi:hypothetical protein
LPFAQKKFPLNKVPSKHTKNLLLMVYGNLLEEAHVNVSIRERCHKETDVTSTEWSLLSHHVL